MSLVTSLFLWIVLIYSVLFCYLFSVVPYAELTNVVLRAGGKLQMEIEAKDAVDLVQKVETTSHFFLDLGYSLI